jgi:DNA repair exonuclease SbcCD ATPase subunit
MNSFYHHIYFSFRNQTNQQQSINPLERKVQLNQHLRKHTVFTNEFAPSIFRNLSRTSSARGRRDSQSSQAPNDQRSTELDSIRQELNEVKNRLANFAQSNTNSERNNNDDDLRRIEQLLCKLEEKQNSIQGQQRTLNRKCDEEKQRLDELYRQFKSHDDQTKPSDTSRQETEDSFQISTVIRELKNRLSILETAHRRLTSGLSQEAINQVIKAREKKTMDREHVIEDLIHGTNDKIKEIQIQYAQLLARLERLPTPITHIDVNQLIQNEIQNFKRTQQNNNESQNLALEAINKVNQLENKLKKISQSNNDYVTRPTVEELIKQMNFTQPPTSQPDSSIDQRFNELEHRLNTIPPPPNLNLIEQRLIQLENRPRSINDDRKKTARDQTRDSSEEIQSLQKQITELNGKKLDQEQIPQILDDIKQRSEQQLQELVNRITGLLETKPDYQTVNQRILESEARKNQQINILQQFVNDNQRALRKMQNDLTKRDDQLDQQPTTTSQLPNKVKLNEEPFTDTLTSKELQTIMPFIELLPTFDMFNENEWN